MRSRTPIIPSILTDNPEEFNRRLDFAKKNTQSAQIDLTDGNFCTGSTLKVEDWPKIDLEYSEAHLMVNDPLKYFQTLKEKNITRAIVHIESIFDLEVLANKARELDLLLGFAVSPDTDLEKLKPFYPVSNCILVMGVVPGSEHQEMLETTPLAVSFLKKQPGRLIVSVDGGVNTKTIVELQKHGANYFVVGSALFGQGDPADNYQTLLEKLGDDQQRT
ncbi:MAG TPA: hypothetical protein VMQ44_01670 [Candidatus Saccharimonadales bacterium]|nr:hypothetical protein [Candidatus Saccharimonadales bacterium]